MGGQWMVDMVGGLAVVCREQGLSSRQAQHPSFQSWPLPLRPSPFCWTVQAEPSASLSQLPSHIQSLPPHSFGLAPLLLGIQPPAGSPRTVLHRGYQVRLLLAQGTQVFRGSGFQALAVRRKGRDSLGIVPEGPNLPEARDLVTLSTYHP